MAFEVFDDVAFYFLAMSVIASITLPWTAIKIISAIRGAFQSTVPSDDPKAKLLRKSKPQRKPLLTVSNILFVFMWILLIVLLIQLPAIQESKLESFDPYEKLLLEKDATSRQIVKAYRALSLKYHPDKNPDDPSAAEKFLEVQTAYDILNDPIKKKDWDDGFLNPSKGAGRSASIGLPKFLTEKANEMRVLVVYFVLFMVLPPVAVFLWWKNAKNVTEHGVHNRTLQGYVTLMNPNMGPKYLIEILAFSAEFEPLQQDITEAHLRAYKALYDEIKEHMMKEKFFDPKDPHSRKYAGKFDYVHRANVLIHAYMMRVKIDPILEPHLSLVTEHCHRLLNIMLAVAMERQFIKPAIAVIDLMQLLTQAMWPHDSPLLQLPALTESDLKFAKNCKSIAQFRRLSPEKRAKMFPNLTPQQLQELSDAADLFPEVSLSHNVSVEDDENSSIYENDLITITATVERLQFDPDRIEQAGRAQTEDDEDDNTSNKDKKGSAIEKDERDSHESLIPEDKELPKKSGESDDQDDVDVENMNLDEIAAMPSKDENREKSGEAPYTHAPRFPHDKREKWVVFLIEKSNKKMPRLIAVKKLPALARSGPNSKQSVELKFLGPPMKGVYEFELHAACDSYIGCDKMESFKLIVHKAINKNGVSDENLAESGDVKSSAKSKWIDEEEPYDGKWYYFGLASFPELLLNIFVLGLLCVFMFNFMWSRGYWQRYVQPSVDTISTYLQPVWNVTEPYLGPVVTPVAVAWVSGVEWLAHKLTVEPPPAPKKPDETASTEVPDHVIIDTDIDDTDIHETATSSEE